MLKQTRLTPDKALRSFPMFAGLSEEEISELLADAKTRVLARNETLFLEDSPSPGLVLILSGLVKVFKLSESGREQILSLMGPGEAVGELPLFDGGPIPASASALKDTEILLIPVATFNRLLAKDTHFCRLIITVLGKRLRKMVELLESVSLLPVRQRLARFLLAQANSRPSFHLAFTNDELAAQLGTVRDVLSRTMSSLQAEGVIQLKGRDVVISDQDALEDIAEG